MKLIEDRSPVRETANTPITLEYDVIKRELLDVSSYPDLIVSSTEVDCYPELAGHKTTYLRVTGKLRVLTESEQKSFRELNALLWNNRLAISEYMRSASKYMARWIGVEVTRNLAFPRTADVYSEINKVTGQQVIQVGTGNSRKMVEQEVWLTRAEFDRVCEGLKALHHCDSCGRVNYEVNETALSIVSNAASNPLDYKVYGVHGTCLTPCYVTNHLPKACMIRAEILGPNDYQFCLGEGSDSHLLVGGIGLGVLVPPGRICRFDTIAKTVRPKTEICHISKATDAIVKLHVNDLNGTPVTVKKAVIHLDGHVSARLTLE